MPIRPIYTVTWTNVNFLRNSFSGIHLWAISQSVSELLYYWSVPRLLSYKTCLDTKPVLYKDRFCSLTHVPNKIWGLCLVPTLTTRFASEVGYRMAKI